MSQNNYPAKTFSDKLMSLLKNYKFKNLVEEIVNEDNYIDYNEIKNELNEAREKNLKKKRFVNFNKKRNKRKNSKNRNSKSKEENKNYNSDNDLKLLDNKEKDLKKPNDSHLVIFFY